MGWILLAVGAALYLGVLRYGWDSRDGLDWQTGVPMGARRDPVRPGRRFTPRSDAELLLARLRRGRPRPTGSGSRPHRAVRAG